MDAQYYREFILDHYKHPRHYGALANADQVIKGVNPSCGDELTFYLQREGDRLTRIQFEGQGCAISQASSSMLLEELQGKTVSDLQAVHEEDVLKEHGGQVSEGRLKCALLALRSLKHGLIDGTPMVEI